MKMGRDFINKVPDGAEVKRIVCKIHLTPKGRRVKEPKMGCFVDWVLHEPKDPSKYE